MTSVAVAYTFVSLGVLLVYAELIRPGMVLPGTAGFALALVGIHSLLGHEVSKAGVALCVAAMGTIAAEGIWDLRWTGGIAGTVALIAGPALLFGSGLPLLLAVCGGAAAGSASTVLVRTGRVARRNKAIESEQRQQGVGTAGRFKAYS